MCTKHAIDVISVLDFFSFDGFNREISIFMVGASLMLKLTMPSSMHMVELANGDGQ